MRVSRTAPTEVTQPVYSNPVGGGAALDATAMDRYPGRCAGLEP